MHDALENMMDFQIMKKSNWLNNYWKNIWVFSSFDQKGRLGKTGLFI